ncbi:MAG TPA: hypothetical protein VGO59_15005 [Verrucomicrobiae bacterium]|jgi:hypothetical protein
MFEVLLHGRGGNAQDEAGFEVGFAFTRIKAAERRSLLRGLVFSGISIIPQ